MYKYGVHWVGNFDHPVHTIVRCKDLDEFSFKYLQHLSLSKFKQI